MDENQKATMKSTLEDLKSLFEQNSSNLQKSAFADNLKNTLATWGYSDPDVAMDKIQTGLKVLAAVHAATE